MPRGGRRGEIVSKGLVILAELKHCPARIVKLNKRRKVSGLEGLVEAEFKAASDAVTKLSHALAREHIRHAVARYDDLIGVYVEFPDRARAAKVRDSVGIPSTDPLDIAVAN